MLKKWSFFAFIFIMGSHHNPEDLRESNAVLDYIVKVQYVGTIGI